MDLLRDVLATLSCQDCARYVCNAMHFKSICCGGEACCNVELDTDAISVASDSDSELEVSVGGCCELNQRH